MVHDELQSAQMEQHSRTQPLVAAATQAPCGDCSKNVVLLHSSPVSLSSSTGFLQA